MRIAISAFLFTTEPGKRYAGVGRNMARVLEQIVGKERGCTYDIFVRSDIDLPSHWAACPWISWHRIAIKSVPHRLLWEHLLVGRAAKKLGCDLLHSLFANLPFACTLPMTTVIHDAFPRTHPQWYTPRNQKILDWMTATGCRLATRVISVSEYSIRELSRAYSTPIENFAVCHNGPGNDVSKLDDEQMSQIPLDGLPDLRKPFVFTVSTLEPRKNLKGLITAFGDVPEVNLLIAGAKGWLDSDIAEVVDASPAKDRITFLGYISDEQLNLLLNKCTVFILPSFVEGFGIPVLEAMTVGAPVITSRTSSLPEVAGEWAIYCDPEDPNSISQALVTALGDADNLSRLAAGGREFASRFTWESSVDSLHEVFRKALGK